MLALTCDLLRTRRQQTATGEIQLIIFVRGGDVLFTIVVDGMGKPSLDNLGAMAQNYHFSKISRN